MPEYALVQNGEVAKIVDLAASTHAQWVTAGNPKATAYRPVVNDPNPVHDPTIQVVESSLVVEPTRVRRAWTVRPKTADELRKIWTAFEFLSRFTPTERKQIWARAKSDDDIADFLMLSQAAQEVESDHPSTLAGMDMLVAKNILTAARKQAILGGA